MELLEGTKMEEGMPVEERYSWKGDPRDKNKEEELEIEELNHASDENEEE